MKDSLVATRIQVFCSSSVKPACAMTRRVQSRLRPAPGQHHENLAQFTMHARNASFFFPFRHPSRKRCM